FLDPRARFRLLRGLRAVRRGTAARVAAGGVAFRGLAFLLLFLLLRSVDGRLALAFLDELHGVADVLRAVLRALHRVRELGRAARLLHERVEDARRRFERG